MSAFTYHLFGVSKSGGRYEIPSQVVTALDVRALRKDGLLHDISDDPGYVDEAAIIPKHLVPKYFLPESNIFRSEAVEWFKTLPAQVFIVILHVSEFESGFGD